MPFFRSIQAFFFTRQSATGFGLMRSAWAAVVLLYLLFQWNDIATFYSNDGFFPWSIAENVLRSHHHYTIFAWITSPLAVFSVYLIFLALLVCMMLGIFPRITTILSVLLLFSFHERNSMVLGGGDTVLRVIGFILMIAPSQRDDATGSHVMPVWPYRLLLWQMIVLYGTSFWYKLLGTQWEQGTAVEIALHHPVFARWPLWFMTLITPITPWVDYLSLLWEGLWILLLIPRWLTDLLPPQIPRIPLKRFLLIGGIFFHLGIFVLMDAGSFSLAVLAAYCGLLREDDLVWVKKTALRIKQ